MVGWTCGQSYQQCQHGSPPDSENVMAGVILQLYMCKLI